MWRKKVAGIDAATAIRVAEACTPYYEPLYQVVIYELLSLHFHSRFMRRMDLGSYFYQRTGIAEISIALLHCGQHRCDKRCRCIIDKREWLS